MFYYVMYITLHKRHRRTVLLNNDPVQFYCYNYYKNNQNDLPLDFCNQEFAIQDRVPLILYTAKRPRGKTFAVLQSRMFPRELWPRRMERRL